MDGKLSRHPLAELIREIIDSELSGALRLSREAARVVVYFDAGTPVFAASNLRAHRLREILKRQNFSCQTLDSCPAAATDEEIAQALIASGDLQPELLQKIRASQTAGVLRVALLWTDGDWQFDQKVRIPVEARVRVDFARLLLESARHLPFPFVKGQVADVTAGYTMGSNNGSINLLPSESFVLSRAEAAGSVFKVSDLAANGLSEEDHLRGIYALSLSGILHRSDWNFALNIRRPDKGQPRRTPAPPVAKEPGAGAGVASADVDNFLARMKMARDHYDVLNISRSATADEIKDAYHELARQYHPDRFHQGDQALRAEIGSAFAQIAQAYEALSDEEQRTAYDRKRAPQSGAPAASKSETKPDARSATPVKKEDSRAETSFRKGVEALERNQFDDAARLLGEAATLEPRQARYRAHYGRALTFRADSRRVAETELQAALAIEPNNASFRVMLAELYQRVGLRRRAETEATKALAGDPNNRAARALLASLKNK